MRGASGRLSWRGRSELRAALAATAFLTRLPLPASLGPSRSRSGGARSGDPLAGLARGAWAFPLVGAGLGAAVGSFALLAEALLTPPAAAALAVAAALLLTGALHLDGLADSADGLGGHTPQQALAIMRDHAVGAYGAAAVAVDLLLKAALIAALLERGAAVAGLVAAVAVARAAVLPVAFALLYARPGRGPAATLAARLTPGRVAMGVAIAAVLAVVLLGAAAAAVLVAAATATATAAAAHFRRRLGGVTGDALGATVELVELACLATLVALA